MTPEPGTGNTFQDKYGNYWNTGRPRLRVAVNFPFERRIAMFSAGFDSNVFSIRTLALAISHIICPRANWPGREEALCRLDAPVIRQAMQGFIICRSPHRTKCYRRKSTLLLARVHQQVWGMADYRPAACL